MSECFKNLIEKLFPCFKTFENWSGNLVNKNVLIKFPKDDSEIKTIIREAKDKNMKIRVAGSCHSQSPTVCDNDETNIIIISLRDYNIPDGNIKIDHTNMTVTVNAGLKLADLYDELNKYNYLLHTQTASSAFTIGGIISMPVHGSRLGAGLIPDTVVSLTLIDSNEQNITKTDSDLDFNLYRLNPCLFGILTSVTLQIIKVNNLSASLTNYYNVFYDTTNLFKENRFNAIIKNYIDKCLNPPIQPEYVQMFVDYHNNTLVSIEWKDDDHEHIVKEEYKESTDVYRVQPLDTLFSTFDKKFRQSKTQLKALGIGSRIAMAYNIESNMNEDRDMFWASTAITVQFLAYYIPVYIDGQYKIDNLYKAINFVMNKVNEYKTKKFNIDIPGDIRFVTSDSKCLLSPIYKNKESGKNVYVVIDLVSSTANISLDSTKISCCNKDLNKDFRQFYYDIEQYWISLGGKVHWGKLYGFNSPTGDPFDENFTKNILSNDVKDVLLTKIPDVFKNKFVNNLIKKW